MKCGLGRVCMVDEVVQKTDVNAALARAEALRRQGAHAEAVALLNVYLPDQQRNGRLWHALYHSHRALGDYDAALKCCENILARQPGNGVALRARIDLASRFQRPDDLALFVEAACKAAPGHLPFQIRRAVLWREQGKSDQALTVLRELAANHPDDPDLLIELATVLRYLGRHAESLAVCEAVPKGAVMTVRLALLKIDALMRLDRPAEAIGLADALLATTPHLPAIELRRGQALRALGRNRDSIAALTALAERHPDNTHILFQLAYSHRVAGDHPAALAVLAHILQTEPTHRSALLARIDTLGLAGDTGAITVATEDAAARLKEACDPDMQALFAALFCKGLPHLPDPLARRLLLTVQAPLCAIADALAPEALWATWRRADLLGLALPFGPLATSLAGQPTIRYATAREILRAVFRAGRPDWEAIACHFSHLVPVEDQALMRVELASFTHGALAALALRERDPARIRPEHGLQIAALLRTAGRIRLASRYLARLWRRFPDHPGLLRDYIACLAGSGQGQRAEAVLREAEARLPAPYGPWAAIFAQAWAELDQPLRGMQRLPEVVAPHEARDWHVAVALAYSPAAELPRIAEHFAGSGRHLVPTMRGALITELLRAAEPGLAAHELTITAIASIGRWISAQPAEAAPVPDARPTIPRAIIQYWSQGTPPEAVQAVTRSWQSHAGFGYRLFDRKAAQDFLHRSLGRDWVRAFNRAGSPTEESDFFRLCYIGLHGGVYADCDDWLIGDPELLLGCGMRVTVYREPTGAIGNNILVAPPRHPAILWAALSARRGLEEGHGDNVWNRTGPGLLTRAIAWHIGRTEVAGTDPALRILPRWKLGAAVQYHSPLPYKSGNGYWNRKGASNQSLDLSAFIRTPIPSF